MKGMGYEGKGLGKYGQGIKEHIEPIMWAKYEGHGYVTGKENDVTSVIGSNKSAQGTKCV